MKLLILTFCSSLLFTLNTSADILNKNIKNPFVDHFSILAQQAALKEEVVCSLRISYKKSSINSETLRCGYKLLLTSKKFSQVKEKSLPFSFDELKLEASLAAIHAFEDSGFNFFSKIEGDYNTILMFKRNLVKP